MIAWVIMQGTFGYWTVSLKLWPQVVTTHLMSGFLTTGLLWLLYYKAKDRLETRTHWNFSSTTKKLFTISIQIVPIQIIIRACTRTKYASYSCTEIQHCQRQKLPHARFGFVSTGLTREIMRSMQHVPAKRAKSGMIG